MGNSKKSSAINRLDIKTVMDTVLDGLIIIDKLGTIQSFNPAAERIFGYSKNEVIGKNVKMLMPAPYKAEHDSYLSNYLESRNPKVIGKGRQVEGKKKNGSVFPMDLGVNEMHVDGNLMFVGTIKDISAQKKAESSLKKYIHDLKRSNQELDDFAYIASHDLKEPLRGLSNNAQFLKEDWKETLDKRAIKRIDRIIFLSQRMEQLVNDLLYFSRLANQDLAIKRVSIEKALKEVLSMMEITIAENNVKVHISKKMPMVVCDSVRIKEVFRNLITNAIKYNDKKNKVIEIGAINQETFFVKDNGIGIPERFYTDVFRIFKRLTIEEDQTRGTGVGLTFVKKIVERHNGTIWIESEMNKGSTFYFTLPQGIDHD